MCQPVALTLFITITSITEHVRVGDLELNVAQITEVSKFELFGHKCFLFFSQGIFLVYDITSSPSFQHIMKWISDVDEVRRLFSLLNFPSAHNRFSSAMSNCAVLTGCISDLTVDASLTVFYFIFIFYFNSSTHHAQCRRFLLGTNMMRSIEDK